MSEGLFDAKDEDRWVSVKEYSELSGLSETSVRRLLGDGILLGKKLASGRYLVALKASMARYQAYRAEVSTTRAMQIEERLEEHYGAVKARQEENGFLSVASYALRSGYSKNTINARLSRLGIEAERQENGIYFYKTELLEELFPYAHKLDREFEKEYMNVMEIRKQYHANSQMIAALRLQFESKKIGSSRYYRKADVADFFASKESDGMNYYTLQEASEYLGISYGTVRQYLYEQKLKGSKLGAKTMISKEEAARFKAGKQEREEKEPRRELFERDSEHIDTAEAMAILNISYDYLSVLSGQGEFAAVAKQGLKNLYYRKDILAYKARRGTQIEKKRLAMALIGDEVYLERQTIYRYLRFKDKSSFVRQLEAIKAWVYEDQEELFVPARLVGWFSGSKTKIVVEQKASILEVIAGVRERLEDGFNQQRAKKIALEKLGSTQEIWHDKIQQWLKPTTHGLLADLVKRSSSAEGEVGYELAQLLLQDGKVYSEDWARYIDIMQYFEPRLEVSQNKQDTIVLTILFGQAMVGKQRLERWLGCTIEERILLEIKETMVEQHLNSERFFNGFYLEVTEDAQTWYIKREGLGWLLEKGVIERSDKQEKLMAAMTKIEMKL